MPSGFSDKELESYYRKEPRTTKEAMLAFLQDNRNPQMVVFGTRAVNVHLPSWLDKETEDWDIFSASRAEEMASKLEINLDKRYGGDFFSVAPAVHPGTFRVKSKVTGVVVADISLKDREIAFKKIGGVNYATLEFLEDEAEHVLAMPEAAYRHSKDRDTIQRILVHKRVKQQKRKVAKRKQQRGIDDDLRSLLRPR